MDKLKVMVCVTQQKNSERLILKGGELTEDGGELYVIHVVNGDQSFLDRNNDGEALEYLFGVSKQAGADLTVLRSDNIFDTMLEFALENNITHIVMGNSPEKDEDNMTFPDRLERELDHISFIRL